MKKKFIVLIPTLFAILLSGCWDAHESERLVYANGLGIDYKDDKVIVYVKILNLQGIAKSEIGGGSPTESPADIGRATGKTLEEAIFNLYHVTDRRIYWGHLSFVIMSEDAAKKHALKFVTDILHRYREYRYRIYFFMTKDSIKDIMLTSPIDNISIAFSKLSDPQDNYNQSSFIQPLNLRELIIKLDEPAHQVFIPIIKITNQWKTQKEQKKDLLIEEVAVLTKDELQGILPKHIMKFTEAINEEFVRDIVILFPNTKQTISAVVYSKQEKITPVIEKGEKVRFKIKLKFTASIEGIKQHTSMKKIEKETVRIIKENMKKVYLYALKKDIDIYRLSETLYRDNNAIWNKIEKNGKIPLDNDSLKSIEVQIRLQHSGKQKLIPIFENDEHVRE